MSFVKFQEALEACLPDGLKGQLKYEVDLTRGTLYLRSRQRADLDVLELLLGDKLVLHSRQMSDGGYRSSAIRADQIPEITYFLNEHRETVRAQISSSYPSLRDNYSRLDNFMGLLTKVDGNISCYRYPGFFILSARDESFARLVEFLGLGYYQDQEGISTERISYELCTRLYRGCSDYLTLISFMKAVEIFGVGAEYQVNSKFFILIGQDNSLNQLAEFLDLRLFKYLNQVFTQEISYQLAAMLLMRLRAKQLTDSLESCLPSLLRARLNWVITPQYELYLTTTDPFLLDSLGFTHFEVDGLYESAVIDSASLPALLQEITLESMEARRERVVAAYTEKATQAAIPWSVNASRLWQRRLSTGTQKEGFENARSASCR